MTIAIRPEDIYLHVGEPETPNAALMRVEAVEMLGAFSRLRLRPASANGHGPKMLLSAQLSGETARRFEPRHDMPLLVELPAQHIRVFPL